MEHKETQGESRKHKTQKETGERSVGLLPSSPKENGCTLSPHTMHTVSSQCASPSPSLLSPYRSYSTPVQSGCGREECQSENEAWQGMCKLEGDRVRKNTLQGTRDIYSPSFSTHQQSQFEDTYFQNQKALHTILVTHFVYKNPNSKTEQYINVQGEEKQIKYIIKLVIDDF